MALKQTIESSTGLTIEDGYIKVVEYSCYGDNVNARLRAYVSQQAANEGKSHIEGSEDIITITADYNDDAPNAKKQIYEHAKTLDKYVDAIDV